MDENCIRRERAKRMRNHEYRRELIRANYSVASEAIDLLDTLYDLRYFNSENDETTHIIYLSSWISPWKKDAPPWIRFPNKGIWLALQHHFCYNDKYQPEDAFRQFQNGRIDTIKRHLAASDPYFAIGYSKTSSRRSPSFQYEVDFDFPIAEENYRDFINWEMVAEISKVITPHFILSGNRSIYVAFFTSSPLPRKAWLAFYDSVRRFLIHSGKNDIHTFYGSGIRLPLSLHQKNGGLCRFPNHQSQEQNIEHLRLIEKNQVSEVQLLDLAMKIEERYNQKRAIIIEGKEYCQSLTVKERRKINRLAGIPIKSHIEDYHANISLLDTDEEYGEIYDFLEETKDELEDVDLLDSEDKYLLKQSLPSIIHPIHSIINSDTKLGQDNYISSYCNRSPRQGEYEALIANGIPLGLSTHYLVKSDFVLFVLNKYQDHGQALETLNQVIRQNISDESIVSDRQNKLDSMVDLIMQTVRSLRKPVLHGNFKRDFDLIELPEEYQAALDRFARLSIQEHKSFNGALHLRGLEYILKKLFYFKAEVGIGVAEIKEHLGVEQNKTASRLIGYFTERYPVMMQTTDYQFDGPAADSNRTKRFMPLEQLPVKIRTKKEIEASKQSAQVWLSGQSGNAELDEYLHNEGDK